MAPPRAVSRSGSGYVLHLSRDERTVVVEPARRAARDAAGAGDTRRAGPAVPRRAPRRAGAGGRVPAADARRAGHQPAGGHRHGDGGARAAGPQGRSSTATSCSRSSRPSTASGWCSAPCSTSPRTTRSTRPTSSSSPPSTTSTATCRGCSTRRCGRCRATSPADRGGILATRRSGRDPRQALARSPPSSARLGRTSRWNATGPVLSSRCSQPDEAPLPPSSSGRGHHPFKVAARVRIPLGVRT